MEEKELFEEIKPLIEEYKEYTNQKMPDVWNDSRASFISKVQDKSYGADREGEILKTLDEGKIYDKKIDDVITISLQTRRELIAELSQIREAKKTEMRSTIFEKVSAFINDEKEKMNKEISEKEQELLNRREETRNKLEEKQKEIEEKKKEKNKLIGKKITLYRYRKQAQEDLGTESKIYRAANDEVKETLKAEKQAKKELNNLNNEYKTLNEDYDIMMSDDNIYSNAVEVARQKLSDFEEIYDKIDFTSENGVYNIETIIGRQEEKETSRMSDGQVYNENNEPVDDMEEIKKMQKQQILKEKIDQRFAEIEKGFEDLLIAPYIKAKENIKKDDDLEQVLEDLQSMDLKDIYAEGLTYFEEGSPEAEELKNVIKLVKEREKEIEAQGTKQGGVKPGVPKPEGPKPEGPKPEGPKPEGPKPEGPKPEGPKPEGTKQEGTKPEGPKPEGPKPGVPKPEGPKPEGQTPERPTPTIKNISIGKEIVITLNNGIGIKKRILDFKDIKLNLSMTNEEKIKAIKNIMGIEVSWEGKEETLNKIDPNFVDALLVAKEEGISKTEIRGIFDKYVLATMGKEEAKASTKQILTYDRRGMDYIKPRNMFRMLTRRKEYDQIKEYALEAEDNNMSKVKLDKPGFIRKLLYKNRPLMIGNKDVYMKTDEERKESIEKKVNRQYKKTIRTKKQLQEEIEVSDAVKEKLAQVEREYAEENSRKYDSVTMNMDINKKLSDASKEMEK